jgi:hypothetical protein
MAVEFSGLFSFTKFILKHDIVIDIIAPTHLYRWNLIGGTSISARGRPEAPRGSQKAGGNPGLVPDL